MLRILINGRQMDFRTVGREVIKSVVIESNGFPVMVKRRDSKVIVNALYDAVQRCTGVIMYRGEIIRKEDVKEFKW